MAGFGGSVKLTGESEYRRAIQGITQDLGKMSQALKTQAAGYNANDKSVTNAAQKQKELTKSLEEQQQKLSQAKSAYASYSVAVQTQTTRHNALSKEYKQAVIELDRIKAASGESSDEYKKQAAAVDKLGKELAESTEELNESKAAMSALKSEINSSQKTIRNTEQALDGLGNEAKEAGEKAKEGGEGFTVMKGILANLATQAITSALNGLRQLGAAVVDVGKQAVDSYANYEQLIGGVETLFKDSAPIVEQYANNAYKTAGMSANQYMDTVTSFSASLLQGLNGDTAKAAKVADQAISDMSDNANKMGTDMSLIQNAYQGFAKQNYTMLDNLKLGYGGTQAEMARLINDSGVLGDSMEVTAETVNQVSYDKIIEAIHVVQDEMGITGTTAKEAATTIEGSKNMMVGSWQNLLTGIADENQKIAPLITNLADSVGTYLGNLLPRVAETMSGMSEAIQIVVKDMFPKISEAMQTQLPVLVENGTKLISSLVQGLVSALPLLVQGVMIGVTTMIETLGTEIPNIVNTVIEVVPQIIDQLMANLPTFIQGCITFLSGIVQALPTVIENLVAALPTVITSIIDGLLSGIDALIQGATTLLTAIVDAIPLIIPTLVTAIPQIVDTLVNGLVTALPELLEGAITLLEAIIQAIPQIIPPLVAAIPQIVTSIVTTLANNIPLIIDAGVQLLTALVQNMPAILAGVGAAIPTIVTSIFDALVTGIPQIAEAGLQLIQGLWEGIKNAGSWLMEQISGFASGIVDGICGFFGINSPSTVMRDRVGVSLADGIGEGFSSEMGAVSAKMAQEGGETVKQLSQGMDGKQSSVTKTAKQLANAIVKTFNASKTQFNNVGKQVSTQIANGVRTASKQVKTLVKSMVNAINNAFKASNDKFAAAGKDIAVNVAKGITSGKGTAQTAAKTTATLIAQAFTSQAAKMKSAGSNLIKQLTSGIKSGQSSAKSAAKAIADAVKTAFTSQVAAMKSAGSRMIGNLASGIKSGKSTAVNNAKDIATAVKTAFSSQASAIKKAGASMSSNFASGIKSGVSDAKNAGGAVASAAKSGASGYSLYSIGSNMALGIKSGFLAQEWTVRNAVNGMVSRVVADAKARMKIKSPSRVWAEIGDYMAQGMAVGFVGGMADTNKTMLNSMVNMLNGVYSFWGISSTSKVMRDKVGKNLVAGIIAGIKVNQKAATKAFDTMQKAMLKTTNGDEYSKVAKGIVKTFTDSIGDSLKASKERASRSWENFYNKQVEAYDKAQAKLQAQIKASNEKYAKQIKESNDQYSKQIKAIESKYDKQISKAKKKKEKNALKAQKKQLVETLKMAKENAEKKLQLDKEIAAKELKAQVDTVKKQKKTLTSQYKTLGNDVLNAYNAAIKNATEGVTDALGKNLQTIADDMQKRMDEVNGLIDDMRGKLKDYGDLFTIDDKGIIELENLNEQVKNINKYGDNLEKLKGKISDSLMDAITSLDIEEGLSFTNKLLNISASELKAYDKAYTAKVNAANNVASRFYREQVQKIKDDYTKQVTKALNDAKKQIETIGKQTMQGFIKGMKSVNWAKDVKSIANDIIKQFKKTLKIKSPSRVFMEIGEYSGEGYTIGLADELKSVSSVMAAAIPDGIGTKTANMAQNPVYSMPGDTLTPDKMVSAFKEALSQMKIEMDSDEMGRFVDRTVTRLVYN